MKKVYAKTLNPECFDYRIYDIREDEGNRILIDGGREYEDIDNDGELKKIKVLICAYPGYDYEYYHHSSIKSYVENGLYPLKKVNGKHFSTCELKRIKEALDKYEQEETITVILSILHCEPYKHCGLRGCCQGEYVEAYYPASTSQKELDYVEAWIFGTGTEVMIHDEEYEPKDADDIEGYTFYTSSWKIEDIKEEVLENYYGTDDVDYEVVLYLYDSSTNIRVDHYKLAEN